MASARTILLLTVKYLCNFYGMVDFSVLNKFIVEVLFIICRPTGVMDRGADCYTKGTGFESRVRHGCKTVRPFIGGNGDAYQVLP